MRIYTLLNVILITLILTGCSIKHNIHQNVKPIRDTDYNHKVLCIIENPSVRKGFLETMKSNLLSKEFVVIVTPNASDRNDCSMKVTYVGYWSWDIAIYLAYANIKIYKNNEIIGEATYDSTSGGGGGKFINGAEKINELVDFLLPYEN